ncbi:MAG: peptide chain release factor N(5)-glutamine methyltransferase [Anaerolineae bacterium]
MAKSPAGEPGSTLWDALVWATGQLGDAGVDNPALDAELLLCAAVGLSRSQLHLHRRDRLTAEPESVFRTMVQRRSAREPLAYIVKQRAFYDLDLGVNESVLIPRPETELLVDQALTWLAPRQNEALWAADIGTGSGAIALTLANRHSHLQFVATDISYQALKVAQNNLRRLGLQRQVHLLCADLLSAFNRRFSLIVANLPYIPTARIMELQAEVRQYEPRQALDGGECGLDVITRLCAVLPLYLESHALVLLEIDHGQGQVVSDLVQAALPGAGVNVLLDYAGLERIVRISVTQG